MTKEWNKSIAVVLNQDRFWPTEDFWQCHNWYGKAILQSLVKEYRIGQEDCKTSYDAQDSPAAKD